MDHEIGPEVPRVESDGTMVFPAVTAQLVTTPPGKELVVLFLRTAPTHFQSSELQCGLTAEQAIVIGDGLARAGKSLRTRRSR